MILKKYAQTVPYIILTTTRADQDARYLVTVAAT